MNRDMQSLSLAAALAALLAAPVVTASETPATAASDVSADADALSIVATVDKDEIAAAKQAQGKKLDAGAMDYARMMERDHKSNLDATRALAKQGGKEMSADAKQVHDKNAATLARIGKLDGAEYQAAYVDAMVKGHTEVLAKLDNELIPNAKDADVKAHLQKTRTAVSTHLDHAKSLQAAR
ncbi:DUF4142 domain-containing protein [Lysobacter sp. A6]|uniref:DUF4142 domain-containing protein n=1 Tax=Noviluteimonas lactosilytica TaxID=2888523 RepID=A0ABS8JID0_9GAMM|nr:DUF4142 domain-containing protein [Lysobacter lactosilyticus]MCC8363361.1 DUF4142 domain-containing protein [Lysobacter lactosilyticus]